MPASIRTRRVLAALLLLVVGVVMTAVIVALVVLRPVPATQAAADALAAPPAGVRVERHGRTYALVPDAPRAGLVFQPGARIVPDAYAPHLLALAERGVLVEVVDQPLGLGLLAADAPTALMARHPELDRWVVGGHSLGGVAAAGYVRDHPDAVDGLLLWASYPADSLASSPVPVVQVIGGNDGLSTPDEAAARRGDLPPSASVTVLPGVNHAAFGDYGPQQGDGPLGIAAPEARAQVVAASLPVFGDALR